MSKAAQLKQALGLQPHIEGGAYREFYRSEWMVPVPYLAADDKGDRAAATSIYFMLEPGEISALHRIASDEIWHHLDGASLLIYEIAPEGELTIHRLGKDLDKDEQFTAVIRAGSWFGSVMDSSEGYALVSCTVAPGFSFQDFELADRVTLLQQYPKHHEVINRLTNRY